MLYLAGGGDEEDSVFIDRAFASQMKGKRMLYLPIAMAGTAPTYEECFAWIRQVYQPLGVSGITMWTGFDQERSADFLSFDGIYIGGGNTSNFFPTCGKPALIRCSRGLFTRVGPCTAGALAQLSLEATYQPVRGWMPMRSNW